MDTNCGIEGCERAAKSAGMCEMHRKRWRKYSDPTFKRREQSYAGVPCSVPGCDRQARVRGYCDPHWQRIDRYGDAQPGVPIRIVRTGMSAYDRVMAMSHDDPAGCRIFTGARTGKGYGRVGAGGRSGGQVYAHRAVWEHHKGPIPEGMVVMHRCDVSSCCAIDHLQIGTYADNTADMVTKGRHWAQGGAHRRLP